jgi:hypothetical protein
MRAAKLLGSCLLLFFPLLSFAQIRNDYRIEFSGTVASGDVSPFWMQHHRWGMRALAADNAYLRAGFFHESRFRGDGAFAFGVDLAGGHPSSYGPVWVQQLYARLQWKKILMGLGAREDYLSFLNESLSSGDLTRSNHARPIPQIRVALSDFVPVPGTRGRVSFRGDFSAGAYLDGKWLEDRAYPTLHNYAKDILSHSKSFYIRWGNVAGPRRQSLIFGLSHEAQWGGTLMQEYFEHPGHLTETRQPRNLEAFLRLVIAKEGSTQASAADRAFVSGSQWGAYLVKYDYRLKNDQVLSAYIQHFFEDGTGMILQNYPDNLYGLEWRSPRQSLLAGVVLEFLYTRQQTGAIHFGDLGKDRLPAGILRGGNDNYYNNVDYVQGPSHFGKTQGTPLFLPPEYNTDGSVNFQGNRVRTLHLGAEGYFHPRLRYRLLLTAGQNWGRYYLPFTQVREGVAAHLELSYIFPRNNGWSARFETGYNVGPYFGPRALGAALTVVKRGAADCLCR